MTTLQSRIQGLGFLGAVHTVITLITLLFELDQGLPMQGGTGKRLGSGLKVWSWGSGCRVQGVGCSV